MKKYNVFFWIAFISLSIEVNAQIISTAPKKKLIFFGWTSPSTTQLRDSLSKYENAPFDGLGFNTSKSVGAGNIFLVDEYRNIPEKAWTDEEKVVSGIRKSAVLTDNFLSIYAASQVDWFSDEDWAVVDKNLRHYARLAKMMNCKGILWDPEAYKPGINPWQFDLQEGHEKHSYTEFYNQVRKRGAQFVSALQEEFPGLQIFSLREFSDFQKGSPFSFGFLPVTDPKIIEPEWPTCFYGLRIPFTVGILDAIAPNVKLIDTNEDAYFYTSAFEFYRFRNTIEDDARAFVPKELQNKFTLNYKIGHAIAPEYYEGNWAGILYGFTKGSFNCNQAKMLSPQEKALWFEHNTYYSLRTADEYAWVYGEKINWWVENKVPQGFTEAIIQAKKKIQNSEPLGFTIDEMLKAAQEKADKLPPTKK